MRHSFVVTAVAIFATFVPTAVVVAQAESEPGSEPGVEHLPDLPPERRPTPRATYTVRTGVEFQISGNEYESVESSFRVDGRFRLNEDLSLSIRFDYQFIDYDFEPDATFVRNAWEEIHTLNLGGVLSADLGSDWTVFGGLYLRALRESSPDLDDSVIGGGFAGAHVDLGDMIVGLGLGIEDRLQDNVRLYPVFVFDWEISDDLRLTTIDHYTGTGPAGRIGRTGAELIYAGFDRDLDLAAGVGSRFRRFRLDSDAPAVDGVGQDRATEFWLRAAWRPTSALTVSGYVGLVFDGELKIEEADGARTEENYDTALFGGVALSYRF